MPATTPHEPSPVEASLIEPMAAVRDAVSELRMRVGVEEFTVDVAVEVIAHLEGAVRPLLNRLEAAVMEAAKDRGAAWVTLGEAFDPPLSRAAVHARYLRFGGSKRWQVPRGGLPVAFDMEDTGEL